jgi:hypothetical protein
MGLLSWFEHRLRLCPICRHEFLQLLERGHVEWQPAGARGDQVADGDRLPRDKTVAAAPGRQSSTGWAPEWSGATPPPASPRLAARAARDRRQSALWG